MRYNAVRSRALLCAKIFQKRINIAALLLLTQPCKLLSKLLQNCSKISEHCAKISRVKIARKILSTVRNPNVRAPLRRHRFSGGVLDIEKFYKRSAQRPTRPTRSTVLKKEDRFSLLSCSAVGRVGRSERCEKFLSPQTARHCWRQKTKKTLKFV